MAYKNLDKRRETARNYYSKNREKMKEYHRIYKQLHPRKRRKAFTQTVESIIDSYQRRAKRKGLDFSLSLEVFGSLISKSCFYCGVTPSKYLGLDRIDSRKGYINGNVVPCCRWCNTMKLNYSYEDFIKKCTEIVKKANISS